MKIKPILAIILFSLSISLAIAQEYHTVTRVIDGDTFEIENGETVRLIGVDTPETVHPSKPVEYYGKEASDHLRKILGGREVRIETDVEKRDRYGRLLAYVWEKTSKGREVLINKVMVLSGLGHIIFYPPNVKYFDELYEVHKTAQELKFGIWDYQKIVEVLGEEQAKNSIDELNNKVNENLKSTLEWMASNIEKDLEQAKKDLEQAKIIADSTFNDFVESLKEGKRIREIVFDNEKLSIYIDDSFYDTSMPDKKSMFNYFQIQYERVSGINNLRILIYDDEEIIGTYDDNGLIFVE